MTVAELLAYCKPMYPTWDDAFCELLLRQLDLRPEQKIKSLSRGMKLKAALLSSLAYHPRLLILDEPFAGLDALIREELIRGMLELTSQDRWTVLMSSHEIDEVERLADWIGILNKGRLELCESVTSLQARFRQIDVRVSDNGDWPSSLPISWLHAEKSARDCNLWTPNTTSRRLRNRFAGSFRRCNKFWRYLCRSSQSSWLWQGPIAYPRKRRPVNLVIHHLKKDLRHLRLLLVQWFLLLLVNSFLIRSRLDRLIASDEGIEVLATAYVLLYVLQQILQIVIVCQLVQADALAGTTAFWVTRPISRKTLLLSKSLFVLLMLVLPSLVAEVIVLWANGISASYMLFALPEEVMLQTAFFLVPSMLVAALTPNLARLVVAGLASATPSF